MGGFIADQPSRRGLKLAPPWPSRGWADRNGEEVASSSGRHVSQPLAVPVAISDLVGAPGICLRLLQATTPGNGLEDPAE